MYLFLLTLQTSSISTNFLQQSTSSGSLAEGISSLSSEITIFTSDLDTSLKDLDTSIDNSISLSSSVAKNLIEGESGSLKIDLTEIQQHIDDIEAKLSKSTQYCQALSSCAPCVDCQNCGWCNSKNICLPGDKSGPDSEDCSDWYYEKCSFKDCAFYKTCSECLSTGSCGWCEFGLKCLKNKTTCSPAFFLYSLESCPQTTASSVQGKYFNPYLTGDLLSLQEEEAFLQNLVDQLELDKEEMLESALQGQKLQVADVGIFQDLSGLSSTVDQIYQEEVEDRQDFRHSLGDKSLKQVKDENKKSSDEGTEKMINKINENYDQVIAGVDSMEYTLGKEIEYVDNELLDIANALKYSKTTNNKK
jgi:hypothetical protein